MDALQASIDAILPRLAVIEKALAANIQDVDEVFDVLNGGEPAPAPDPDDDVLEGLPEHEETPEEEAARLRREAIEQFEAGNEAPEAAPRDFNDFDPDNESGHVDE